MAESCGGKLKRGAGKGAEERERTLPRDFRGNKYEAFSGKQ
jgi:hypothetical protein